MSYFIQPLIVKLITCNHLSCFSNVNISAKEKKKRRNLENVTLSAGGNWMIYLSRVPEQIKIILAMFSFFSCWQSGLERHASCDKPDMIYLLESASQRGDILNLRTQISQLMVPTPHPPQLRLYIKWPSLSSISLSTHSLLTFTMSALNKNLGTSNSVIPPNQKSNMAFDRNRLDGAGQLSSCIEWIC